MFLGTLAIYYYAKSKDRVRFCFLDFPIINNFGKFESKDLLVIDVNLDMKRMKTAKLDGQELTASQTMILLFFYTISANHVKIHSLANWGVNVEPEQEVNDPFHARNSLITTMYNYMGYSGFTQLFPFWKSLGLLDICCEEALVIILFEKALLKAIL